MGLKKLGFAQFQKVEQRELGSKHEAFREAKHAYHVALKTFVQSHITGEKPYNSVYVEHQAWMRDCEVGANADDEIDVLLSIINLHAYILEEEECVN
jgi:hypothetical protein